MQFLSKRRRHILNLFLTSFHDDVQLNPERTWSIVNDQRMFTIIKQLQAALYITQSDPLASRQHCLTCVVYDESEYRRLTAQINFNFIARGRMRYVFESVLNKRHQ